MAYSFLAALAEHQHVPPCVVVRDSCPTLTAARRRSFPHVDRHFQALLRPAGPSVVVGEEHTLGGCCNPLDTPRPLLSLAPSSDNAPCSPKQRQTTQFDPARLWHWTERSIRSPSRKRAVGWISISSKCASPRSPAAAGYSWSPASRRGLISA